MVFGGTVFTRTICSQESDSIERRYSRGVAAKKNSPPKLSVQYRVTVSKADVRVDGPDDAEVVFTCALADALADPTAAYVQGKLKATGHTGVILGELMNGNAAKRLSQLASRP